MGAKPRGRPPATRVARERQASIRVTDAEWHAWSADYVRAVVNATVLGEPAPERRPAPDGSGQRAHTMAIRLTEPEWLAWSTAADADGRTLSGLARRLVAAHERGT